MQRVSVIPQSTFVARLYTGVVAHRVGLRVNPANRWRHSINSVIYVEFEEELRTTGLRRGASGEVGPDRLRKPQALVQYGKTDQRGAEIFEIGRAVNLLSV